MSGNVIRFVQLREHRGKKQELVHFGSLILPAATIRNGELVNPPTLKQSLQHLLNALQVHSICVVLPERHTFLKHLELKSLPAREINEAIRWEAAQHIPYDLSELYADWTILNHAPSTTSSILLTAVPRSVADPFFESIEDAGLMPLTAEPVSLAAARLFEHQFSSAGVDLLLILGDDESTAVLIRDQQPVLSVALPFTTNSTVASLQETFRLDREEAQKARVLIGYQKSRAHGVVRHALELLLGSLTRRIKDIQEFYHDHLQDPRPLSQILVCGSGAATAGLEEELTTALSTRIVPAQLPSDIIVSKHVRDFQRVLPEYAVALGAARHAREVQNVLT